MKLWRKLLCRLSVLCWMFVQLFDLLPTYISLGYGSWQTWKFYLYESACTPGSQEPKHFKQSGRNLFGFFLVFERIKLHISDCSHRVPISSQMHSMLHFVSSEQLLKSQVNFVCCLLIFYKPQMCNIFTHSNYPLPNWLITECWNSCLLNQMCLRSHVGNWCILCMLNTKWDRGVIRRYTSRHFNSGRIVSFQIMDILKLISLMIVAL